MKKILKAIFIVVAVIGLSGCVKFNVNMNIGMDKSVKLEMINGMNMTFVNSLMEGMNNTEEGEEEETEVEATVDSGAPTEEEFNYLEKMGFKVEAYEELIDGNNFVGVKISKVYSNIDDITHENPIVFDFVKLLDEDQNYKDDQLFTKKGENYLANFVFDFSNKDGGTAEVPGMTTTNDLKYVVTLPQESISNNATTVSEDGKTLTWDLKLEKNEINYEFSLESQLISGIDNMILFIGIGIGIVVLLLIILAIKSKKNKVEKVMNQENIEPTVSLEQPTMPIEQPAMPTQTVETPMSVEQPVMPTYNVEPTTPVEQPEVPTYNVEPTMPIEQPVMPTQTVETPMSVEQPEVPTYNVEPTTPVEQPVMPTYNVEPTMSTEQPAMPTQTFAPETPVEEPMMQVEQSVIPTQTFAPEVPTEQATVPTEKVEQSDNNEVL